MVGFVVLPAQAKKMGKIVANNLKTDFFGTKRADIGAVVLR